MSAESFLSRWSRKMVGGETEIIETKLPEGPDSPAAPQPVAEGVAAPPKTDEAKAAGTFVEPPPLESVANDGDFAPFMQREIAPELRNQAMKKLFTDPHYNVMDRLDTYIDDYSKPDPMPAGMLQQLYQSKALFLFDDEEKKAGDAQPPPQAVIAAIEAPADKESVALSPAEKQPQPKLEE